MDDQRDRAGDDADDRTTTAGALPSPASDDVSRWSEERLAEEFPQFSRFELLGTGGFAVVFSTDHPRLARVALKVLTGGGHWSGDENGRRAFRQRVEAETKAIGSLSAAPTIVTLYTSGTSRSGWPYLVMDLCPGGSLKELIARHGNPDAGPMPLAAIVEVGRSVGSALATAHEQRILHLDVKPANILVDRYGNFLLSDFGIARSLNEASPVDDESFLTPHFAPPELWEEPSRPEPASDVYSLGVTLFQMAMFRRPFEGSRGTELAERVRRERPAPIDTSTYPAALSDLVASCLEKDPGDRPSAHEVVHVLQSLATAAVDDLDDVTRTLARGHHDRYPAPSPGSTAWSAPDPAPAPPTTATPQSAPAPAPEPAPHTVARSDGDGPPGAPQPAPPLSELDGHGGAAPSGARRAASPLLRRVALATTVVVLAIGIAVALGTRTSRAPAAPAPTDAELRAAATGDVFPPPGSTAMSTTARRGVATSVQLSVGDGGEAVLSWSSDDDTATYVVLAGRFEVDGATGEPSTTPDAQGLLGEAGSIATGDDEVLRLTGRARSTAVQVDPTVITCFAVVLVTPEEGVPSPTKPCWPSAPPAGPEGVRLEPTPGTELATVTWRDRSNDEARFRVLGIRDQHGREEVVESVVVDADGERATVRLLPNTCYLVRAENAANALPDELAGSPRPDPAGASRDDACT